MADGLEAFESVQDGAPQVITVRLRQGLPRDIADAHAAALTKVPWSRLGHAYGDATDVPVLLYAISVGDAESRGAAWRELWGNVHHQGTVYEATVRAVPFIASVATASSHPDRVQAICFLREIALGSGEYAPEVRAAVSPHAEAVVSGWQEEPELVQRSALWLASAFPSLAGRHPDLVRLVPKTMRLAWQEVVHRVEHRAEDREYDEADDPSFDREHELERWALAGWVEEPERS